MFLWNFLIKEMYRKKTVYVLNSLITVFKLKLCYLFDVRAASTVLLHLETLIFFITDVYMLLNPASVRKGFLKMQTCRGGIQTTFVNSYTSF